MEIKTSHFGEITIDPAGIISFPAGLPGFEECHRFTLLQRPEEEPVAWLQSIERQELAFAVVEPEQFLASYTPQVAAADLELLQLPSLEEALVLAILVLDRDPRRITVNLQAPVLINREKKLGAQVVLREEWPRKYYLFPREEKAAGNE